MKLSLKKKRSALEDRIAEFIFAIRSFRNDKCSGNEIVIVVTIFNSLYRSREKEREKRKGADHFSRREIRGHEENNILSSFKNFFVIMIEQVDILFRNLILSMTDASCMIYWHR